jgi:hypothetical protein
MYVCPNATRVAQQLSLCAWSDHVSCEIHTDIYFCVSDFRYDLHIKTRFWVSDFRYDLHIKTCFWVSDFR